MKRLLVLLLLASCGGEKAAEAPLDVRTYVPTSIGDRWRTRSEPGGAFDHVGVSAHDAAGHAIVHGTDRAAIEIQEVRVGGAYVVDPSGRRLVPILVAPIVAGHETRYTVAQGDGAGSCTLRVLGVDRRRTVAGVRFERCVEQRRTCALPAGGALPQATTITEDELLCPGVGRVEHRFRASPPLPFADVSSDRATTLVSFAVRGAPRLPEGASLADRLIVLPSDVAAACGGSALSTELRPGDAHTDVSAAFTLADGPLRIEARRASAAELDAYVGPYARSEGELRRSDGPPLRLGFDAGRALVRITPGPSCSASGASRLEPLLRSLLR